MTASLCPWLGTQSDRQVRYAEPSDRHLCFAQRHRAGIDLEYQAKFCLSAEHTACSFFREPPPAGTPAERLPAEDEVGTPPLGQRVLRPALWVLVGIAAVAVMVFYGSTLFRPAPVSTPTAAGMADPSATATATPTVTATPVAPASPLPTVDLALPAGTPTPYPGGAIYVLSPAAEAAGWVAGDEGRGNHLGDSYLYSGVFDGVIYHGFFQIDLSRVPRGAKIHAAVLELTGLDGKRLGGEGTWEVRVLDRAADEGWSRQTFQDVHNAPVQWTLLPALGADGLVAGEVNAFGLTAEMIGDLEQRLLDQHYTVSFRIDGPATGENSVFAWDTGSGSASRGHAPRLWLSVGAPPQTPVPTGVPEWVVVTSTPTPQNAVTAAALAELQTAWATTTGTATVTPQFVVTATPLYVVVTNTPTPANLATAQYLNELATARVILTGTPTPTPPNLATATATPLPAGTARPTATPVLIWLDAITGTPTPRVTPSPTVPPIPAVIKGNLLFLSSRGGQTEVYMLQVASGRVAKLTARWPYDEALRKESIAPDGQSWALVQNDGGGVAQVYVHSQYYKSTWQVTFNTGLSYSPVWSPVGNRLAFVSTEGGNDDIYVVNSDGSDQRRLTLNNWEWDKHPTWSPDGTKIVFWSNQDVGYPQLWIIDADGRNRRQLLSSPYADWDPVWVK